MPWNIRNRTTYACADHQPQYFMPFEKQNSSRSLQKLISAAYSKVPKQDRDRCNQAPRAEMTHLRSPVDCLVSTSDEPHRPDEIFNFLCWGGVFIFVSDHLQPAQKLAGEYDNQNGFYLEKPPAKISNSPVYIPFLSTKGYYFIARRVHLIKPGEVTDRFTYNVCLHPDPDQPLGYVVKKTVPQRNDLFWRLRKKYTKEQVNDEDLIKRTNKLVDRVFPTFITREAGFLLLLQERLPKQYRHLVPRAVQIKKDKKGFVHELHMNWLRNTCTPISHLEFACQSAQLLKAIHENVNVMHLDLRLDNFVITDQGVGFVDFGSAARIGENLDRNDMVSSMFSEIMRTSQIQQTLGKMLERGHVTSQLMGNIHGKADKAVDLFYLSVQITQVHKHPIMQHLVNVDEKSDVYAQLKQLNSALLRPKDPQNPDYKTADDMLQGILKIKP